MYCFAPIVILPTEASELMEPDSKCSLPPVQPSPFSCLAAIPSWTFNSTAGKCVSYMYGGCGKTGNLFSSQDDCNAACGPKPSKQLLYNGTG
jgi:Kunitz/Bovine pancreatic trypsin inhibitor domain